MKVIVIAGTHSGVGKTSLATGLMQALRWAAELVSSMTILLRLLLLLTGIDLSRLYWR
jgi:deoxyadenosine/deoxycytidine kinase